MFFSDSMFYENADKLKESTEDVDENVVDNIKVSGGAPAVAKISTWRFNCALSCTSVFVINAFLDNTLSKKGAENLTRLINNYYGTSLTIEQIKDVFEDIITLPFDRQAILGPVLRDFILKEGIETEKYGMFSDKAFLPLAKEFGFNVVFYSKRDVGISESIAIPQITVDSSFKLTLKPYYHESHYDLIMDDQKKALAHNQAMLYKSPYGLLTEEGKEKELIEQFGIIIQPKKAFEKKIKELIDAVENSDDIPAIKALSLVRNLQGEGTKYFEQKSINLQEFKTNALSIIKKLVPEVGGKEIAMQIVKNIALFIVSLGVGYLAAAVYNKIKNGNFFFFSPKKENHGFPRFFDKLDVSTKLESDDDVKSKLKIGS